MVNPMKRGMGWGLTGGLSLLFSLWSIISCTTVFNTEVQIQYFGFALVDCSWDDPNDLEEKTNYIDEVSAFCNVAQMAVFQEEEDLSDRLALFQSNEVRAVLSIENLLFEPVADSSTGSGVRMKLRSDYRSIWDHFVFINKEHLTSEYIAALYLIDEPCWNGVSYTDLETAANTVKSILNEIPLLVIEAYPVIEDLVLPASIDWYGFDRYDTCNPGTDSAYLADLQKIKSKQSAEDQHLVMVMDTQFRSYYSSEGGIYEADMSAIALNYYELAKSEPNVIAVLGYLWPGGLDEPSQKGARNLPLCVQEVYAQIGREITGK